VCHKNKVRFLHSPTEKISINKKKKCGTKNKKVGVEGTDKKVYIIQPFQAIIKEIKKQKLSTFVRLELRVPCFFAAAFY